METENNLLQQAYFGLIALATFNNMNGEQIIKDLKQNPELWEIVVPGFLIGETETFKIREALEKRIYFDTLYIKTTGKCKGKLQKLAKKWQADRTYWIRTNEGLIFKVWFD